MIAIIMVFVQILEAAMQWEHNQAGIRSIRFDNNSNRNKKIKN